MLSAVPQCIQLSQPYLYVCVLPYVLVVSIHVLLCVPPICLGGFVLALQNEYVYNVYLFK